MIVNITRETFGGALRMGDMVAACNVVEHLRLKSNNPNLRFYFNPDVLGNSSHCHKFHQFLLRQTNYLTENRGDNDLAWRKVNLWDFRDISGDLVKIPNNYDKKKKIVICPVLDAPYNIYRNWPKGQWEKCVENQKKNLPNHQIVICVNNPKLLDDISKLDSSIIISTDFDENLKHIMECEVFIGGDTGTSHFAWSLENGPIDLIYLSSSRGLVHTLPFYLIKGKGLMQCYWMDFEGTRWE